MLSTSVNNLMANKTIIIINIETEGKTAGRRSASANRQKTIYNPVLPFAGFVKFGSPLPTIQASKNHLKHEDN